jgi:hypothetical protein
MLLQFTTAATQPTGPQAVRATYWFGMLNYRRD